MDQYARFFHRTRFRNLALLAALLMVFISYSVTNTEVMRWGAFDASEAELLRSHFNASSEYFESPSRWTSVGFRFLESNTTTPGMSDANIYALSGWEYMHGANPASINPEHPPLAKYLIGLSEIIFTNPSTMSLIFGILTILAVYLISKEILGTSLFALLPPYMLAFDKLFFGFSVVSMLDIYVTFFVALATLLFIRGLKEPRLFPLVLVTFGLAMASKWIAAFLFPAFLVVLFVKRDWRSLKWLLASLPLALLTYTLTYAMFFIDGNSLGDFVGLQQSMLHYQLFLRQQVAVPPLRILQILTTGISGPSTLMHVNVNLTTSEATITSVEYGIAMIRGFNPLTWSISFAAALLVMYYALRAKDHHALVIPTLLLTFIAMFSTSQVFEWYLLPVLFAGFTSVAYLFKHWYGEVKRKRIFTLFILAYLAGIFVWFAFVSFSYHIPL